MQATRATAALRAPLAMRRTAVRCLTTTANPAHVVESSSSPAASSKQSTIPLSNIAAQWDTLSSEEKHSVFVDLEAAQKKDWKTLSLDEKRAAYYVAFGPYGPRAPAGKPGDTLKIILSVGAMVGIAGALHMTIRSFAPEAPKSTSKEWQEASNERALAQKANPITGISSEGYKGPGFVSK